jgi:acyl carrier protein
VGDVSDRIREFIATEVLFEETSSALMNDTPLLGGILDSLGLMQLISFVENEFEVEIDDAEVTADHFRTVGAIESLVTQKARVG